MYGSDCVFNPFLDIVWNERQQWTTFHECLTLALGPTLGEKYFQNFENYCVMFSIPLLKTRIFQVAIILD